MCESWWIFGDARTNKWGEERGLDLAGRQSSGLHTGPGRSSQSQAEPKQSKAEQGREGRPAPQSSLLLQLVEGWPLHRQVVVPL